MLPTAAPPTVPSTPPVSTAPPTAPTPAPIVVFLSCLDMPEQPPRPSSIAAATALSTNLAVVFVGSSLFFAAILISDGPANSATENHTESHTGPRTCFARCVPNCNFVLRRSADIARLAGSVGVNLRGAPISVCLLTHLADELTSLLVALGSLLLSCAIEQS